MRWVYMYTSFSRLLLQVFLGWEDDLEISNSRKMHIN